MRVNQVSLCSPLTAAINVAIENGETVPSEEDVNYDKCKARCMGSDHSQYTVRSRANGNSSKWESGPKIHCKLFASKWEFEQMGMFPEKSCRMIENGNISCQMRQF